MLNNSRFPNWYWKKVKGMQRSNKVIPILVVLRKSAYIHLLHLLMHALIFLKAQLWSPSIKVLQKPPIAYQIKNKSLGESFKVFHNMTTLPSFPVKKAFSDVTKLLLFLQVQTSHLLLFF